MPAQKTQSAVRLVNRAAHLKYINLGDGESVAVPPTVDGTPGTLVKFDNAEERARFDKALEVSGVQQWIEAGELEVQTASASSLPASPAQQVAETAERKEELTSSPRTAAGEAKVAKRETSRE